MAQVSHVIKKNPYYKPETVNIFNHYIRLINQSFFVYKKLIEYDDVSIEKWIWCFQYEKGSLSLISIKKFFFYIEKSNKRVERFTVAAPEPFYVFDKKCLIDHSKRW